MSKLKDEIKRKDEEWEAAYEEYSKEFTDLKQEASKKLKELDGHIMVINSTRDSFRTSIGCLYKFLAPISANGIEEVTTFDFVPEHAEDLVTCLEKVPNRHTPHYKKTITPREKTDDFFETIGSKFNPVTRHGLKNVQLDIETSLQEEKGEWEKSKKDCKKIIDFYILAIPIASLYRAIMDTIMDTVENTILPELSGIKAFLLAEAVKERVVENEDLKGVEPIEIIEYEHSDAYVRHFLFVKNACDFYTMLCECFTSTFLKDFLEEKQVSEAEQQAFEQKIENIKRKKDELSGNAIFTKGGNCR